MTTLDRVDAYRNYLEEQMSNLDLHLVAYPKDSEGKARLSQVKGDLKQLELLLEPELDLIDQWHEGE